MPTRRAVVKTDLRFGAALGVVCVLLGVVGGVIVPNQWPSRILLSVLALLVGMRGARTD